MESNYIEMGFGFGKRDYRGIDEDAPTKVKVPKKSPKKAPKKTPTKKK